MLTSIRISLHLTSGLLGSRTALNPVEADENTLGYKLLRVFLIALFLLTSTMQSEGAPYRVDSGDVIEVSVFRRDDLRHRITVDADGNIWVPLVGEIHVAGMTLPDLRTKVRELLAASDAVRLADITIDLLEYRPFYIYGSVPKAGAYPYRPRITVRHAIALAGGIGNGASGVISPGASAELRGRHAEYLGDLMRYKVKVAGLQAELAGKTDIELKGFDPKLLTRPDVAEIISLERERLKSRQTERVKERQYVVTAIKLVDAQVAALERGQAADEEATKIAVEEYQRVMELNRKGLAPTSRVTDEQQAAVLFKIRERDTAGRLALARQTREELLWRLEKADEQKAKIPDELQVATAALSVAQARFKAVSEQLSMSNDVSVQLDSADSSNLEVSIFRSHAGGAQTKIAATEETEIEAGDVVEVKMKIGWSYPVPGN
ncbi:polysaccharide biosynthesis/export family protein [Microvirga splendida]|uniref:Polysaccharide biosynthesis/export family protein n=1 Tax=Microvirga splendida TaxID=2795727 RepID=A0ABS0Y8B6_9HYPH|nr:polysaccharide biosynthesis/export family protein [Microvirga splendida]MBJ6128544.1 polysaccharide biosynthesis/export family protein [Microvirga splendida]